MMNLQIVELYLGVPNYLTERALVGSIEKKLFILLTKMKKSILYYKPFYINQDKLQKKSYFIPFLKHELQNNFT